MTLFNNTGDWQLGIFGSQDADRKTCRACKNSLDRNEDDRSVGSMAIICITVKPHEKEASLGLWLDKTYETAGASIGCAMVSGQEQPSWGQCAIAPAKIGKSEIALSENPAAISRILSEKHLTVFLGNKNDPQDRIEFDVDLPGLKKTIEPAREFFSLVLK